MSSRSRNDGRRDDRPTLPPIRDLFQGLARFSAGVELFTDKRKDLRGPHNSSSLTLARLRVSDDSDAPLAYVPDSFPSRTFGDQNLGAPSELLRTSQSPAHQYQYHDHRNAYAVHTHQSNLESRWSSSSPPGHALRPSEGRGGNEPDSSSHVSRHLPPQASSRRNTFDSPGYPYRHRPIQYRDDNSRSRLPFDVSYQGHGRHGTYPPRPGEIYTAVTSVPGVDDERTPVARYGSAGPSTLLPITQNASAEQPSMSAISKYECGYCGKGFNRPSSLKVNIPLSFLTMSR
jgi:hypothetical protein